MRFEIAVAAFAEPFAEIVVLRDAHPRADARPPLLAEPIEALGVRTPAQVPDVAEVRRGRRGSLTAPEAHDDRHDMGVDAGEPIEMLRVLVRDRDDGIDALQRT